VAGIDKNTPDPFGGKIVHDPSTGEPTGVLLHYPAENLVMMHADGHSNLSDEDLENDIKRAQDLLLSAGITSGQDVIIGSLRDVRIYKKLASRNELKMRMYLLLYINSEEQAQEYAQEIEGYKSDFLTFGGWKLAVDGGVAAGTALMYNENLLAAKNSYYYYEPEVLNRIVRLLHDTGLQIAFHIIGDKGIDEALNAIELAMRANRRKDPRHRIEHAIFVDPKSLKRIKRLGVVISTQPGFASWMADGYREGTDDAAMANFMIINSLLKMKIPVAFGCDVPAGFAHEPKWTFIGATLRKTKSGYSPSPEERIDIHRALKIHTMGSAYAASEEKQKGSIETGKLADLVVWSHDFYSIGPDEATKLEALMTIVNGQIVFEKD
jgi:predicted amidohydrolase YtcJ